MEPSSLTIVYIVPNTPSYFPGGIIASSCAADDLSSLPLLLLLFAEGLLLPPSAARTYSGELRTATWPRRRTVSRGRLMKRVTEEERNLAREKVVGDISLSILNRVRRTSGVVILRMGCTSEWRTVGRTRGDGQR